MALASCVAGPYPALAASLSRQPGWRGTAGLRAAPAGPPADPGATVRLPRSKPGPALSSRHAGVAKHVLSAAVKPDETDSELVFPAAVRPVAEQRYYEWGAGKRVAYRVLNQGGLEVAPLVLLTGFGVGSFHYDRLLKEMKGDRRDIYLMDFFGQGAAPAGSCHVARMTFLASLLRLTD